MYVAMKVMKVQTEHGVEIRQPGDAIPEAENWPNPLVWERRGFIARKDAPPASYDRSKMKPATPAQVDKLPKSPVPKEKEPLPGYQGQGNVVPAVVEAVEEEVSEDDESVYDELYAKTRDELNHIAESIGIERPDKLGKKENVVDAIIEVMAREEE